MRCEMSIIKNAAKALIKAMYFKKGEVDGEAGSVSLMPHYMDKLLNDDDALLDDGEREKIYILGHAQGQARRIDKIEKNISDAAEKDAEKIKEFVDATEVEEKRLHEEKKDVCKACNIECSGYKCECYQCPDDDCLACDCYSCLDNDDCRECNCFGCNEDCDNC